MIPPYPLQWPEELPRTKRPENSKFKTTLAKARDNIKDSLRRFGEDTGNRVTQVVATSNMAGILAGQPEDKAVAVWFLWDGQQRCIAVDKYNKIECNLQAIHHVIEARRTEFRHGGLAIVRQTFKGFTALPAPGFRHWTEVLNVSRDASKEEIKMAFRARAIDRHPDRGGSAHAMAELTEARDQALRECS